MLLPRFCFIVLRNLMKRYTLYSWPLTSHRPADCKNQDVSREHCGIVRYILFLLEQHPHLGFIQKKQPLNVQYKRIRGEGYWFKTHLNIVLVIILTLQSLQHSPSAHTDPFVSVHEVALQHGFVHSCAHTQTHMGFETTCEKVSSSSHCWGF